jgi:hypothetical protein
MDTVLDVNTYFIYMSMNTYIFMTLLIIYTQVMDTVLDTDSYILSISRDLQHLGQVALSKTLGALSVVDCIISVTVFDYFHVYIMSYINIYTYVYTYVYIKHLGQVALSKIIGDELKKAQRLIILKIDSYT